VIKPKRKINSIKRFGAYTLIVVYALALIPFVHSHEHLHESHSELSCSSEDKDACHNYIYHGVKTPDCAEHSHASTLKTKCLSCHANVNSKKWTTFLVNFIIIKNEIASIDVVFTSVFTGCELGIFRLRGPPVV